MTLGQNSLPDPTAQAVQIGAVLDRCVGRKAKEKIAKSRVDFVLGNINSYARILNGAAQLDEIKSYNELAASMTALQSKKQKLDKVAKHKKKEDDTKTNKHRAEKERKAKEKRKKILPTYKAHVMMGVQCSCPQPRKQTCNIEVYFESQRSKIFSQSCTGTCQQVDRRYHVRPG